MLHTRRPAISTLIAASLLFTLAAAPPATSQTIDKMLAERALEAAYNPVLLDYLLEEGATALPEEKRKQALDQLVTALKQDIEITPEEQRAAALAAAGAGLAELFGGRNTSELGAVAGDATYQIWRGWVDSAFTLHKAGYSDDATAFFEKCIDIYPYSDLRGRCAIGLAASKPDEAVARLMALTESADPATINAALRILGQLAGAEDTPDEVKGRIIEQLKAFTTGLKKASYGLASCQGLVASSDPRAVPTLQTLSTGMMNADFHRCSRRGLLLTLGETSVVPVLEKQLSAGKFSTVEPWDRFFAASVLMEGGVESGYAWAMEEFAKGQKEGKGKGFMKKMMATEEEVDFKPSLVTAMARIGGDRSVQALLEAKELVEPGTWIETWIAIGLLELGDTTHIGLAKAALGKPEWEFTTVRVSTALAEHGDYSGVPALEALNDKALQGLEPDTGRAVAAFLAGEGNAYLSDRESKKDRLVRLRSQIAAALAEIDRPESLPGLIKALEDPEFSVRVAAAYGLTRMTDPAAAKGLVKAIEVDYGSIGEGSRNPVVHARVARAAGRHDGHEGAAETLSKAATDPFASVRFLALCEKGEA